MMSQYAHLCKILGQFLRPEATFPEHGLGIGAGSVTKDSSEADKAFVGIKLMAKHHIEMGVMDEAAAIDGTRPLEQIADSSGIAWGGTVLQMKEDLKQFTVLLTAGKGLTPAQQAWAPLTSEGFAQLETKRAQRKALGTHRSVCWTDHANWTRQQTLE